MKEPFEIMTDQEHYSLRWNNHQNHILRAFDTLLQTKTLVDVTLVCAETSIRAHKVVLSACSPFFQRVFSETPCKHPVIVLKDFRGWVVQAIVDFMYRGEISVPQERLSVLIQAGESLQVRGLVDHPVAGNTPTPAQSPEDFSLLESSLISPTTPSLPSPNFPHANHQLPSVSTSLRPQHHHAATSGSTSTPKMLLPPQVFADPAISLPSAELCTSPMPRRKQARPRRRSGDCAPQDLSSKPTTPVPPQPELDDDEQEGKEEPEERAEDTGGDEEDIEGLEEEEDEDDHDDDDEEEEEVEADDLKRILCRSQSVDEKLAAIVAKEDQRRAQSRGSAASEERRSRSLHKAPAGARKTGASGKADRSRSKGDDGCAQMPSLTPSSSGSSVSDGPENLCMKKSSPSSGSSNNNQHPASIEGPANSDRHSPAVIRSTSRDGSTRLGGDGMKDTPSPLSDPSGIGRGLLSLKDIRHLNRAALNRSLGSLSPPPSFASSLNNNLHPALGLLSHHHLHHHHHNDAKRVKMEHRDEERSSLLAHDDMEPPHFLDHMDLALGTHQHPLATHPHLSTHHHLRGSSPQLRPPPVSALLEGIGPENNNSSSSGGSSNSKKNNGGGGNNHHGSFLHHHHHHHGNANSKHHHQHHGHPPQHHPHHSHLQQQQQQSTTATGSPGAPPNHPTGNGDGPGGPLSSNNSNNNNNNNNGSSSNGGNNSNSSGSKNNNNNNNNNSLHHPSHHPQHPHGGGGGGGGPKGSTGPGSGPKDFLHSPTLNFPPFFNHSADGPPRPPHSPLPFPHMPSVSSLTLTPPHMFGLDSPLGLFPPGMDPGKIYSPLMEMSDPRGMHHDGPPFLKKKMNRPKGQHSAPRGGPPRSWTNAELTEALQHVWNKKMTTSQASRIFGIPYNSLLMYVRGKYGKSLKLEQLRKDCISGPPIELLQMGVSSNSNSSGKEKKEHKDSDHHHHHHHHGGSGRDGSSGPNNGGNSSGGGGGGGPGGGGGGGGLGDLRGPRSASSEPELLSSPNPLFNPFPGGFYPDFPSGFPGLPLSMLNLLPPERHPAHSLPMAVDEDCKSDRSKQSLDDDYPQPLALNRPASEQLTDNRREIYQQNGQD